VTIIENEKFFIFLWRGIKTENLYTKPMSKTLLPHMGNFPCSMRKSKRVKHLQLKVSSKGVELIIPFRCSLKEGIRFFESKQSWLEAALSKLKPLAPLSPPASLYLSALEEFWTVDYVFQEGNARLYEKGEQNLLIKGPFEKDLKWQRLLQRWLKRKAQLVLPPLLQTLSDKTNLTFNEVRIRGQRTRWGSCSAHKNINLNYQILFLPLETAQHILLHELCHTVHMNHSASFWKLLRQLDPQTLHYEKQLKEPRLFVPEWI
jgi:predicted metal-dependent hydrolase